MKKNEAKEGVWYIVYIISNILTLGGVWFLRGLITHAIKKAFED